MQFRREARKNMAIFAPFLDVPRRRGVREGRRQPNQSHLQRGQPSEEPRTSTSK